MGALLKSSLLGALVLIGFYLSIIEVGIVLFLEAEGLLFCGVFGIRIYNEEQQLALKKDVIYWEKTL